MTTDPCRIQEAALMAAVTKQLHDDARTTGFAAAITVSALADDDQTIVVHFSLDRTGWKDPCVTIARAWYPEAPDIVAKRALDFTVEAACRAIRGSMCGTTPNLTAAWAVLAHPLVISLGVAHETDRARLPLSRRSRPAPEDKRSDRWDVDAAGDVAHEGRCGVATGELSLDNGMLHANSLSTLVPVGDQINCVTVAQRRSGRSDKAPTTLTLPLLMPRTMLAGAVGRQLQDVVNLRRTYHPDIDNAVDALVVVEATGIANGIQLAFDPATYIPYGIPPGKNERRAMALAPVMG